MKKLLLMACIAMFAFSCTGPQGPPGQDGTVRKKIITYTLYDGDWDKYYADGLFMGFRHYVDVPELTSNNIHESMVSVYVYDEDNFQKPLERVIFNEFDGVPYQTQLFYDFGEGEVGLYYQDSEFNEDVRPGTFKFRIVIFY